jgi:ribosomal protein bL25 (Ctc-form)
MATVKELKATARPKSGKGAARAERRAGRVPGVIYGNNQPPVTISVDDADLRQRILAGRFLTTIYDVELEGKKHRVIPRDFHLDPVRDFPIHVDFMRLGEGATIRVSVPLHIQNAESSPGVKRGGTVNIVTHTIDLECSVELLLALPRRPVRLRRPALLPLLRPRRVLLPLPQPVPRLRLRPAPRRLPVAATRRSNRARDAASWNDNSSLVSGTRTPNTRTIGIISASWPSMKLRDVTVLHRGVADFRARSLKSNSMAKSSCC